MLIKVDHLFLCLDDAQKKLVEGLFRASRGSHVSLHLNKGLAGAEPETIAFVAATATNPSVCTAFALAMVGAEEGPAYPGIPGHEPSVERGRAATKRVRRSMTELTNLAPNNGAYLAESNCFEPNFQYTYWGDNYERLALIKQTYDPDGFFFVHNGVGSEAWSDDGFTRTI